MLVLSTSSLGQRRTAASDEPFDPNRARLEVGIDQRLGSRIPPDLSFRDDTGRTVRLGDYLGERPVLFALVYYRCRSLCTQVLQGSARLLRDLPLELGRDFDFVAVSIDPAETPEDAAGAKRRHLGDLRGAESGAHFLVGDPTAIETLATAVGFRYVYYPSANEFAHGSGVMLATPDGRLSHYFYGILYEPQDVRLALVEASDGRIGSLVDQFLLLCFHYDPLTGKYGFAIYSALRLAGLATAGALIAFLVVQLRRERRPVTSGGGA